MVVRMFIISFRPLFLSLVSGFFFPVLWIHFVRYLDQNDYCFCFWYLMNRVGVLAYSVSYNQRHSEDISKGKVLFGFQTFPVDL